MDDLIPFLIFIVIALINLVKFVLEKGGKSKPASPTEQPKKAAPSTLEDFFEKLAGKLEPQPTPVPDWPEGFEQPDYLAEQETYETMQTKQGEPEPTAEIIPIPVIKPVQISKEETHAASLKTAMAAIPSLASGFSSLRMPSSQMKSNNAGSIHYSLRNKAELRKAIIANVVFSTPRACDPSFENTVSK
ncbi:hypothetical protein P4C99_05515 [Pontiellaceae bacterium B1224]|nr:hypothetical protein [Pontiellaceae bacterium B1224]